MTSQNRDNDLDTTTSDSTESRTVSLDTSLGRRGTLSFEMTSTETFQTGDTLTRKELILEIPGFAKLKLWQSIMDPVADPGVLWLIWDLHDTGGGIGEYARQFTKLSAGRTFYVQITWDADQGYMDAYIDGNPLTPPGRASSTGEWDISSAGARVELPPNDIEVSNITARSHYLPVWRAPEIVPEKFQRKTPELWGLREEAEAMDIEHRKRELLYSADMSAPEDIADWPPVEGPGAVEIDDGWLHMWSPDDEYHHVLWCPEDFPNRIVAEWEAKMMTDKGLSMVLFAATGPSGQDIFAPDMPERTTGDFSDYQRLQAYHTSYFAGQGRITSNLRKDGVTESGRKKFYLMEQGPVGILSGAHEPHHIRLIKDGRHIQFQVDGTVHIDYSDDVGERFGPRYKGGKIGFRQMVPTDGYYRNFRVWELNS